MVLNQEIVRMGGRGYGDGLNSGMVIGLPPVMNFGQEPLRSRVLNEVFSGEKVRPPPVPFHAVLELKFRSSVSPSQKHLPDPMSLVYGARRPRARMARLGLSTGPRSGSRVVCTLIISPSVVG